MSLYYALVFLCKLILFSFKKWTIKGLTFRCQLEAVPHWCSSFKIREQFAAIVTANAISSCTWDRQAGSRESRVAASQEALEVKSNNQYETHLLNCQGSLWGKKKKCIITEINSLISSYFKWYPISKFSSSEDGSRWGYSLTSSGDYGNQKTNTFFIRLLNLHAPP